MSSWSRLSVALFRFISTARGLGGAQSPSTTSPDFRGIQKEFRVELAADWKRTESEFSREGEGGQRQAADEGNISAECLVLRVVLVHDKFYWCPAGVGGHDYLRDGPRVARGTTVEFTDDFEFDPRLLMKASVWPPCP